MIHIIRLKNRKFEVVETSDVNGQFLRDSKQGFERRAGCYTNLRAGMKNWNSKEITFQDDTLKEPAIFRLYETGDPIKLDIPARPIYKPVKN